MPPDIPTVSELNSPAAPPPLPPKPRPKWGLAVAIAVLVLGIGIGAVFIIIRLTGQNAPTPTTAPGLTTNETSQITSAPLGKTELQVTALATTTADIDDLLVRALRVTETASIGTNLTVGGNGAFTGNITAANFQGSGAGLTNVNATTLGGQAAAFYQNIANLGGVVRAAQLPTNLALRDAANTFTAANTFGAVTASSLALGTPLPVASGGTGLTAVGTQGILYGQTGGSLGVATPAGAGLCLLSGATDVSWGVCSGGGGGVTSLDGLTGVLTLANSSGSGATVTINDASTAAKGIASFSSTNFTASSGLINTIQNINTAATPTFAGLNANSLTPSAALTVGATGQTLTLQGSASTTVTATGGGQTTTIGFSGSPTGAVTYNFDRAATAGSYTICTTIGNCAGSGSGVTTSGGTINTVPKFTASQALGNSIITDNGSTVTIGGTLAVNSLTPTAALTIGATGQSLTLQGNGSTALTATSGGITNSLVFATPATSGKTITIPNATGTVAVTATGPLALDAAGNLTCSSCVTSGGGGGGVGAVDSLNSLTGALTIANASTGGSTITINDATTAAKGIASFSSTNFTASSGAVNTIQNINSTATPTFGALTLQNANALTLGTTGTSTGAALFKGSTAASGTITLTLATNAPTNNTISLPNETGTVCTTGSICAGYQAAATAFIQGGNSFATTATLGTNDGNDLVLERNNLPRLTIGANDLTLATDIDLLLQGTTSYISNPRNGLRSEAFGLLATTTNSADDSLAVGYNTLSASGTVAVGANASANTTSAVALGAYANTNGDSEAIAIGYNAATGAAHSIAIGTDAVTTAANQLVIGSGSTNNYINHVYIGNGITAGTPIGVILQASSAAGSSDLTGADIALAAGQGTGLGVGGDIIFSVAPPDVSTGSTSNPLTPVATLSGTTGGAQFQNATNGTAAFAVLNATSVPQFQIDTTNSRVYIGNPTADATGALLVLDTKNTSGDPTGVDGGMYYNSALGVSRCYADGYWRDCVANERTTFSYLNDFIKVPADNTSNDQLTAYGTWFTVSDPTYIGGHPGVLNLQATNAADKTGVTSGSSFDNSLLFGNNTTWRYETLALVPIVSSLAERYTVTTGFNTTNDTIANFTNGCYFRYSDNVNSGNWQGVCEDGTESVCDTTTSVTADTWYRLTLIVNAAGTSVDFNIDGVNKCTITTHIPSSSTLLSFESLINKDTGTSARDFYLDYLSVRGQFSSPR